MSKCYGTFLSIVSTRPGVSCGQKIATNKKKKTGKGRGWKESGRFLNVLLFCGQLKKQRFYGSLPI